MTVDDRALISTLTLIGEYEAEDTVAWSAVRQLLDIIKRQEEDLLLLTSDRLQQEHVYVEV